MAFNSCKTWTLYHLSAFVLTFLSYAFFHATRKTFSNVKATILDEWTPEFHNDSVPLKKPAFIWTKREMFSSTDNAETFLGVLDTVFMISYAVGLFVSGVLGDRFNLRYVLTTGMLGSALVVVGFGCMTEWLHIYNVYLYVFLWGLNGLIQSLGWPAVVAVMGNWFGKTSRGWVMGIWSACASVGNIIGSLCSAAVVDYGYEYPFLVTAAALGGFGLVVFCGLVPSPKEVGLPDPDSPDVEEAYRVTETEPLLKPETEAAVGTDSSASLPSAETRQPSIGLVEAVKLPGVAQYSLAYACLKMVNYAFFFWLPFYLSNKFGWKQSVADDISIWYDVGGIIGGIIAGFISDLLGKRSVIVQILLVLSFPALYVYSVSPNNQTKNSVLLGLAGVFVGGAANLISSAITADLGRQEAIAGNARALATVTGIIDGTGSVGAAIGQFLVPEIQTHLNWHWVFYFFLLMNLLTMLCITRITLREVRELRTRWWLWRDERRRGSSLLVNSTEAEDELHD